KTFLGKLFDLEVDQRHEATAAAHALGVSLGCRLLRAHDVRSARRVRDMLQAILEASAQGANATSPVRASSGHNQAPMRTTGDAQP
ncbi:MAG TPA: hypothetical protein VFN61_09370, partial [Acidimicrobiales bacterium]|nr:hypothetical protein [Acidimicrobiales bacterium]